MSLATFVFWWRFVKAKYFTDTKILERLKTLRPFIVYTILAYASIGGHQVGEYFAILSGDQFIYKLGLISSILSIFFGARAIEKLTQVRIGSWFILAVIIAVSADIFLTTFSFENRHFWVRGDNHTVWSTAWFTLWTYVMLSGIYISRYYNTVINKKLLRWAFLGVMNVSFVLSVAYAVLGAWSTSFVTCTEELFTGFVFGKDFPSIWCTFSVAQAPFLYLGLRAFARKADTDDLPSLPHAFWKRALVIALITILLIVVLKLVVPIIFGVSWKMITK